MSRKRSRTVWTPKPKPKSKKKATAPAPERKAWTPGRSKSVPAPTPNKSNRVLADVSKLKAARHDHGWRFEEYVKVHGKPGRGRRPLGARWTCDYHQADGTWGCKSFVWQHEPGPGQFHSWDCIYWQLEGKDFTPFEDTPAPSKDELHFQ